MKTKLIAFAASAAAVSLAISPRARAAGTALDVQSGRGTGMAAAVTAFINDSSAIFYNPAGIAQGKGIDVQLGTSLIVPTFKYTSPGGDSTSTPFKIIPPVNLYASGGITENLSAGIGLFSPYGLTVAWPNDWVGRSQITQSQLQTFYVNPTLAYRLGPLRIGAGFQLVRATVDLQRKIAFPGQEGSTELGGATWGYGGNVGVQIEAIPKKLSFGAHYRSAVKLAFDGSAHFDNVPRALADTIHDQPVSTAVIQPNTVALGVAVRPIPTLVLDADVVWYSWSQFTSVDIRFPNDASGTLSSSQPKNWSNTVNVHVGGEYTIDDTWRVRAGALYDPTPTPDNTLTPDIPDARRLNLAAGGSYHHKSGFRVDLGYQFLILFKETSTAPALPGDYGGFVNILGISLGYSTPHAKPAAPPPPI